MNIERTGEFFIVDYASLTVGAPAGDRLVIECPSCKRPGIQWRGTKRVAHLVQYRKEQSGKERIKALVACKSAVPPPAEPPRNLGFPWCPKEML